MRAARLKRKGARATATPTTGAQSPGAAQSSAVAGILTCDGARHKSPRAIGPAWAESEEIAHSLLASRYISRLAATSKNAYPEVATATATNQELYWPRCLARYSSCRDAAIPVTFSGEADIQNAGLKCRSWPIASSRGSAANGRFLGDCVAKPGCFLQLARI